MEKGLTVKDLYNECLRQIKKGNGDKYILISDDDEGNGYHTLLFGIMDNKEELKYVLELEHDKHELNEIVALG